MQSDIFGQDTTLQTPEALQSWNDCQLAFLAHGAATPQHLGATLEAEPDFALGQAVKGMFYLLLGRSELIATAREALGLAEASAMHTPVTPREHHFINALKIWMDGKPSGAIDHFEQVLANSPSDTLAMKLCHAIRFVLGDSIGMRASIERVMGAYGPDHVGRGYLMGCHAFALEETGEYARAKTVGRMGLAISPDDAWGLHAVAHVHDMTADAVGGIDWLTGREAAWAHCNNFRYHVWWHKALMHLDLGQTDVVLSLYDTEIRSDKTDDYRDISNATSLLSRLELDGVDVGDRWEELAEISATRTEDGCLIFADLHYLLALIGGGKEDAISKLMGRMHEDTRRNQCEMDRLMASPGLSAAAGLEAFGEADYRTAFLNLAKARQTMQMAGGSHAQRDVFERLTIDAGIRAGFLDEAESFLRARTSKRDGHEDGYAAARMALISAGRDASGCIERVPAE
ncbi:tetratricopeptide repeat protein [Litoreibacter roseus]|uniref:Tetratricopeptide repeat protein 38 n=1 Tax=Litoreibacter roseus TaxID=2601869 RepID=A0A6N6JEX1_9RHOB|nr:tetratricopeptide repeat protein [Litoreibacter roseus]GFE63919.1 tetratricopeptide repeat protein 38 family protein [Litoreibacter roseus]